MASVSTTNAKRTSPSCKHLPPVTTSILILLCLVFFVLQCLAGVKHKPHNLRPNRVLVNKEYYRLFTSALMHRNYQHLGMNLLGCWSSGSDLERKYGWRYLLRTTLLSMVSTPVLYVVLAHVYNTFAEESLKATKGFSGVLFHWMTVECLQDDKVKRSLFGITTAPAVWYPWILTILLAAMDTRSSWLIHTCGILTGTLQYYAEGAQSASVAKEKVTTPTEKVVSSVSNVNEKMDPASLRRLRLKKFDESMSIQKDRDL